MALSDRRRFDSAEAERWISGAVASLSPDNDEVAFRRTFAFTVYTDAAADSEEYALHIVQWLEQVLNDNGFTVVGYWGPHIGSAAITLFGHSTRAELGEPFREKLHSMASDLAQQVLVAMPEAKPASVIRIAFWIGNMCRAFAGIGSEVHFVESVASLDVMSAVVLGTLGIAEELGEMFYGNEKAKRMLRSLDNSSRHRSEQGRGTEGRLRLSGPKGGFH